MTKLLLAGNVRVNKKVIWCDVVSQAGHIVHQLLNITPKYLPTPFCPTLIEHRSFGDSAVSSSVSHTTVKRILCH